eukprot:NODE_6157_length_649_cov_15.773333_g5231_i0.p1 GENE.NODE_6157_length_649_cov_15.773333_g5231_i0~~NODE_6157_length_649_cov_15.773333_g5231_i0.p1  ORF type:complete len:85 (-),score=2.39 NODE_6157_length_649_cov_15.773333_g5231_i0:309-563(-)
MGGKAKIPDRHTEEGGNDDDETGRPEQALRRGAASHAGPKAARPSDRNQGRDGPLTGLHQDRGGEVVELSAHLGVEGCNLKAKE